MKIDTPPGVTPQYRKWVGCGKLADRYGVAPATIADWARRGIVPPPERTEPRLEWNLRRIQTWENEGCPKMEPQEGI